MQQTAAVNAARQNISSATCKSISLIVTNVV